jgi:hypothetical protein
MTFKMPENFVTKTVNELAPGDNTWISQDDIEILTDRTVAVHPNTSIQYDKTTEGLVRIYKTMLGNIELDVSAVFQAEPDFIFSRSLCESEPIIKVTHVTGIPEYNSKG